MLQSAAAPATSILALGTGGQVTAAENGEIPEGFAALLAIGLKTGADGEALPDALPLDAAALLRQNGKASGNVTGKILPLPLPEGAAPTESEGAAAPPAVEDAANQPAGTASELIPTPLAVMLSLATPALPDAISTRTEGKPSAPDAATPAITVAAAPAAEAPAAATTITARPAGEPSPAPVPTVITAVAAAANVPLTQAPVAKVAEKPGLPTSTTAETAGAATPSPLAAPKPATIPLLAAQAPIRLSVEHPAAARTTLPARPETATPAAPTATLLQTASAAAPQPAAEIQPGPARVATPPAGPAIAAEPQADRARAAAATTGETLAADTAKPIAAELRPMLALRDAQLPAPGAGTAAAPAPVVNVQHGGHDFGTLVDRLVEARDAAMPQAIRAAIQHSEFGQVSLRFQHDDARLTVSMTAADPDFAPAVQAAAAMQASAGTADNGSNGQRQDGAGQQQAGGTASGQPQSQAQAQSQGSARGGERDRADGFRSSGDQAGTTRDETTPGQHGGIYA